MRTRERHPAQQPAVVCEDIKKSFGTDAGEVMALRGINLEVFANELLMLVGPSGCGKTTLISVLAGILNPDPGGRCIIFGREYEKMDPEAITRFRGSNIGFVFQAFNLIPTLSITENVAVPLLINGKRRKEAMQAARDLLEKVGLADRRQDLPTQLSGGQQQRVAIARAIVHNPRLVVCDEPTSSLDHQTGLMVLELLREIAVTEERALIVVTHDARIFSFATRIAQMDDGRITRIVRRPEDL